MEKSLFVVNKIEDNDRAACKGCPLNNPSSPCYASSSKVYHREGTEVVDGKVDLIVVTDPPSKEDSFAKRYWSDKVAKTLTNKIKKTGVNSFIITPAVRCFPRGQISHFTSKKNKYKRNNHAGREKPLEIATKAVEHCSKYVHNLLAEYAAPLTLAMGPLALAALGVKGKAPALRAKPIIAKGISGISFSGEGTIVTHDRAFATENLWAQRQVLKDIEKIGSFRKVGFATPEGDERTVEYLEFTTVAEVKRFVDMALTSEFPHGTFASLDFETTDTVLSKEHTQLLNCGICFTSEPDKAYVIPLSHPETPFSSDELQEVYGELKRLFQSVGAKFYGWLAHHAQFETEMIKLHFDVWLGEDGEIPIFDTENIAYCIEEDRKNYVGKKGAFTLLGLSQDYLGWTWYKRNAAKSKRTRLENESLEYINKYVAYDAVVAARLLHKFLEHMEDEGSDEDLLRLNRYLYSEAILYTSDLRMTGQAIDVDLLQMLRAPGSSVQKRIKEVYEELQASPEVRKAVKLVSAGKSKDFKSVKPIFKINTIDKLNLKSNAHRKILFHDVMQLEGADESVDSAFQERHKDNKVVSLYSEYTKLTKLDSTYMAPLAEWLQTAECIDGRIRPSFNLINTVTGRLSASEPNSQNVPRGDSYVKKQIKALFKACKGKVLVQLDFSQAEVRWLGILSGDEALISKYRMADEITKQLIVDPTNAELLAKAKIEGDLHMSTALDMYKLPRDYPITHPEEAKLYRQKAKSICFGLIYGKTVASLARDLGVEEEEMQEAVDKWMGQFPQAAEWLNTQEEIVKKHGYVVSAFGRWRRLPEANAQEQGIANRAARQSRNTPIQASASDACIIASARFRRELRKHPLLKDCKLINTVHDSLIGEVPNDPAVIEAYAKLAYSIFTDPNMLMDDWGIELTIPLAVDFDVGLNWGNMREYNLTPDSLKAALHDAEVLRAQPPGTLFSDLKGKGVLSNELQVSA